MDEESVAYRSCYDRNSVEWSSVLCTQYKREVEHSWILKKHVHGKTSYRGRALGGHYLRRFYTPVCLPAFHFVANCLSFRFSLPSNETSLILDYPPPDLLDTPVMIHHGGP